MRHGYWRRMGIGAAWHALLPSAVAAVSGHGDNGVPYVQRRCVTGVKVTDILSSAGAQNLRKLPGHSETDLNSSTVERFAIPRQR